MIPPFPDNQQWLQMYQGVLGMLFERNFGDFLIGAFATDVQDAWARAAERWRQSPESYQEIQERWQQALDRFNAAVKSDHNPQSAIRNLKKLHSELRSFMAMLVDETPDLSGDDRRILQFCIRQLVNAMSPEFWPLANEEVVKTYFNTGGASIIQGFNAFQQDVKDSVVGLDIKTAGKDDFKVGETLAITPGEVVFQNRLFQLIQYYPFSQEVYSTPLLIVPPWINKFYVLDLNPTDSFVQWAVRQGYTVFMISWVNPEFEHRNLTLSDYLVEGCITAIDTVREITGEDQLSMAGYCIGGLLATCAVAYLAAKNNRFIKTLTLLNTMLDHSEPGDIGVFLSSRIVAALENRMKEDGVLDGRILRQMFTMLREDRMFWPYVVNNYFLGKSPKSDPVLFWNHDATNIPLPMLVEIIKYMYHENILINSRDYMIDGVKIRLDSIDTPVFVLACKRDHIVPWKGAYKSVHHLGGETSFILCDAGHVMGVVNSPNKNRNGFWQLSGSDYPLEPDHWVDNANWNKGSWWEFWHEWHIGKLQGSVRARFPGGDGRKIIERAPGGYVTKTIPLVDGEG